MALPVAGLIVGFLIASLGSIIGRIMWMLGISVVYITGMTILIDTLYDTIKQKLGSLGAASVDYLSLMQVDVAISIVLSAITLKLMMRSVMRGGLQSQRKFKF